jgi:hypothetical protein
MAAPNWLGAPTQDTPRGVPTTVGQARVGEERGKWTPFGKHYRCCLVKFIIGYGLSDSFVNIHYPAR